MTEAGNPASVRVLSALIEARTGQQISAARNWRMEASLKPVMREAGVATLDLLVGQIAGGRNEVLTRRVVEALLNNETSFFRDAAVFEQIEREALESLRKSRGGVRRLRIWSAACSTGQEPYSLAMMFRDAGARWAGWTIDILATDISATAVARAKVGRFSRFEIQRGLPVRTMLRWFREEGEEWTVDAGLRRDIRFATHDIRDAAPGQFDLILCRNLLMYLAAPVRNLAFGRLADALDPCGILMLGAGETVIGQTDRLASHPGMRGLYVATAEVSQSPLRVASR